MSQHPRRRDLSGIVTGHPDPDAAPVLLRAWSAIRLYLEAERPPGWVARGVVVEAIADFIDASPALIGELLEAAVDAGVLADRRGRVRFLVTAWKVAG